MGKFSPPPIEESVTPNLIPMIDIMFLLLLFFMLGADISQRELTEVILPQADQVQETSNVAETGAQYLTVNIHPKNDAAADSTGPEGRDEANWLFAIRGQEFTAATLPDQLELEADRAIEPEIVDG